MLVRSGPLHNRFVKLALREAAEEHWAKRIPEHFKQSAHSKYGYAKRNPGYILSKIKRFGRGTDLVRTGDSEKLMRREKKIRVGGGGKLEGGGRRAIKATLQLRFAFKGGSGRFRKPGSYQAVTITQMIREVQTFTAQEAREIAAQIQRRYVQQVNTTSARQRVGTNFNVMFEDNSPNL